ncbi:MAG: tetratricopeptide repeat-containing serine protease family protein [Candidatus Poribacteria bacterium]|nr:tetratricopeptide repeat-containing serine protease family protein [Candidatus Poribacteria bacterium]
MTHQKTSHSHPYIIAILSLLVCVATTATSATVHLEMTDTDGTATHFGSGFFITDTLIATSVDIVKSAAAGTATLVGKDTKSVIESVVAVDPKNGLILLNVAASDVAPLPLGDSDAVKIGDTVYLRGSAEISLEAIIGEYKEGHFELKTAIQPMRSGAPVLNSEGEVIGVYFNSQERNYVIPSNALMALLNQAKQTKNVSGQKPLGNLSAEFFYRSGRANFKLKDYTAAIADFTEAISHGLDDANPYFYRAEANRHLKQYAATLSDYDEALKRKPDHADAFNNRGLAYHELKKYPIAIIDFRNN